MAIKSISDLFGSAADIAVASAGFAAGSAYMLASGMWAAAAVKVLGKLDLDNNWEDSLVDKNGSTFFSLNDHLKWMAAGTGLGLLGGVGVVGMGTLNTLSGGSLQNLMSSYATAGGLLVAGPVVAGHLYTGLEMAGFGLRNLFNRSHDNQPAQTPAPTPAPVAPEDHVVSRRGLRMV